MGCWDTRKSYPQSPEPCSLSSPFMLLFLWFFQMQPGQHWAGRARCRAAVTGLGALRAGSAPLVRHCRLGKGIYNGSGFTGRVHMKSVLPCILSGFHIHYFINMEKIKGAIMSNYVNLHKPSVSGHLAVSQLLPRLLPFTSAAPPLPAPEGCVSRSCHFSFALWWAWGGLGSECLLVNLQYSWQCLWKSLGARKLELLLPGGNLNCGEVSSINTSLTHHAAQFTHIVLCWL